MLAPSTLGALMDETKAYIRGMVASFAVMNWERASVCQLYLEQWWLETSVSPCIALF